MNFFAMLYWYGYGDKPPARFVAKLLSPQCSSIIFSFGKSNLPAQYP